MLSKLLIFYFCLHFIMPTTQWSILDTADRHWVEKQVKSFDVEQLIEDVDTNKDGTTTLDEYLKAVAKADKNNDGQVLHCEWIPYAWKRYKLSPRISQFMLAENKDGLIDFKKIFEYQQEDTSDAVTREKFKEIHIRFIRRLANLAYEAVNGPVIQSIWDHPEIARDTTMDVMKNSDKNKNGVIEPSDFDIDADRCFFETGHVEVYGSTRWFFSYVFTLLDTEGKEVYGHEMIDPAIRVADRDNDGRDTLEEHTNYASSLFRASRLFTGLYFSNPWVCEDESITSRHGQAARIALDADHDQDGVITSMEYVTHTLHFNDDNGDGVLQLSEFTKKLIRRYNIPTDIAVELFEALDTDKDGVLDIRTESFFFALDKNQDGIVSFCEYKDVWEEMMELAGRNLSVSKAARSEKTQTICEGKVDNGCSGSSGKKHLWSEKVNQKK